MKWLLITAFLLLAGVAWNYGKIDKLQRDNVRLRQTVDSLQDVIAVRQWIDRRNFSMLISNVQWHNINAVFKRPQIKRALDKYNEYWQLWLEPEEE